MLVKVAVDSDDELPFVTFSCSNVPSKQKNGEDTANSDITEASSGLCHDSDRTIAVQSADMRPCAHSAGVVVVDSDSSDSDSWKECMFKYNKNLQERCNASTVLSSADCTPSPCFESCDLQLGVNSAGASVTDDQSCCNTVTDDSPAAWKSCESSETQTTASDVNSQSSSVQSDGNRRRKRPQKADDPEAVVCSFQLPSSLLLAAMFIWL